MDHRRSLWIMVDQRYQSFKIMDLPDLPPIKTIFHSDITHHIASVMFSSKGSLWAFSHLVEEQEEPNSSSRVHRSHLYTCIIYTNFKYPLSSILIIYIYIIYILMHISSLSLSKKTYNMYIHTQHTHVHIQPRSFNR